MKQTVEKAKQDFAKTERELTEIDATYDVLAAETQAALTRITADTLAGVTSEREGARLREQATRKRDEVEARRETLRLALPELKARLEAAEEAARVITVEKLRDEVRQALAGRAQALRRFDTRPATPSRLPARSSGTGLSWPPPWMFSSRCSTMTRNSRSTWTRPSGRRPPPS